MGKLKKTFNTLKYVIPFVVASLLGQQAKGQEITLPTGVLNPFLSPDTTAAAKAHNNISTISERNRILLEDVIADWTHTIPWHPDPPIWNCNQWSTQMIVNSHDWGGGVYDYQWNKLLFNGYKGFVLEELYSNGGTLKDMGKLGYQMFLVNITDPITRPEGHAMTGIFSGNDILDPNSFNNIEPRDGITKVQPGEINIPLNCERYIISYPYISKNSVHEKNLGFLRILEFKIANGQKILTYNINDDPNFNKTFRVITRRDTIYPEAQILSPLENKIYEKSTVPVMYKWIDENLVPGSTWYSLDGGKTKISVPQSDTLHLNNLKDGDYKIIFGAEDYFRLKTIKEINFSVRIDTAVEPPITEDKVLVYPNPASEIVTLKYPLEEARIELYDMNGKKIKDIIDKDRDGRTEINIEPYPAGLYPYRATVVEKYYTGKIIKK